MLSRNMPRIGVLPSGPRDLISDVAGVTVGHATLAEGDIQTGVTVIRPHPGNVYRQKVPACTHVINGHTKSSGSIQIAELGVIETTIALTNTLSVGEVMMAQVRETIRNNPEVCRTTSSVNPVVGECSDARLNDIQRLAVRAEHYEAALADARADFALGSVGAGRGMVNFGLKGGIGSASRVVEIAGEAYTAGILALTNYGQPYQLTVAGEPVGRALTAPVDPAPESGSCIFVLATDAPLEYRQLKRIARRVTAGLARTGSIFGHGSGDEVIAFTTAYTIDWPQAGGRRPPVSFLYDESLDPTFFEAVADATEQSVLKALWAAETVTGYEGRVVKNLLEAWEEKFGAFAN